MFDNDWIKNLKPGDSVIVKGNWSETIKTVDKITPSGLIKIKGTYFNPNGMERGGDPWRFHSLYEATQDEVRRIQQEGFIRQVLSKMHQAKSITYEQAVDVLNVLNDAEFT